MQPGRQTLQATPPGWPARARALRGWVPMRTASTTRARCGDTRLASLLWRCDPLWRQCIRSIASSKRCNAQQCSDEWYYCDAIIATRFGLRDRPARLRCAQIQLRNVLKSTVNSAYVEFSKVKFRLSQMSSPLLYFLSFLPHRGVQDKFSPSQGYFFIPNGFNLGRLDCT